MAWVTIRGLDGLVWRPDPQPVGERKHHCRDCFTCQMCSDARCARCLHRARDGCAGRGKSTRGKRPPPHSRSH